jgi:hypothetical protein
MPRSVQTAGVLARTELIVFDANDNRVTGLLNASFVKRLTLNGVTALTPVTVTEIDAVNRPGEYTVTWTPPVPPGGVGEWFLYVYHPIYNPRGWQEEFDVTVTGPDWGQRIVDGFTVAQGHALMCAANQGKVSGAPLTPVIRAQDDSADRITATCDASGDRTVMVLNPPPP